MKYFQHLHTWSQIFILTGCGRKSSARVPPIAAIKPTRNPIVISSLTVSKVVDVVEVTCTVGVVETGDVVVLDTSSPHFHAGTVPLF